jgi:hypothetical protein
VGVLVKMLRLSIGPKCKSATGIADGMGMLGKFHNCPRQFLSYPDVVLICERDIIKSFDITRLEGLEERLSGRSTWVIESVPKYIVVLRGECV